jgi:hypothetical protein
MTDNRLWVTAYAAPDREVLVANIPGEQRALIFSVNQHLQPRALTNEDLAAVRASGITPTFYSIPNPF